MNFHVIMPISTDSKLATKQNLIRELAEKHGYSVHFPTYSISSLGFDLSALKWDLQRATFIVADLSYERPSCYYELGVAEALDLNVFLIASIGTDIHQTSKRAKVKFYRNLDEYRQLFDQILIQASSLDRAA